MSEKFMNHASVVTALKVTAVVLIFVVLVAAAIVANFYASRGDSAFDSLFARLNPAFYYRTVVILLLSSLLYTPISYGISKMYLSGRRARFSDMFVVFTKPRLFVRAVLLRLLIWVCRGRYQLSALFFGVVVESLLYALVLSRSGVRVWNLTLSELLLSGDSAIEQPVFLYFSVLLWFGILLMMMLSAVRFSFCKYALLRFEELSVWEAKQIGLLATRGQLLKVLWYYMCRSAYYVLLIGSFGLLGFVLQSVRPEQFSRYATRLCETARRDYFANHRKYG